MSAFVYTDWCLSTALRAVGLGRTVIQVQQE